MDIQQKYEVWKNTVLGLPLDVDHAYGDQCADVPLSWGMTLFPGVAWTVLFKPVASAKDFLQAANPLYFEVVKNDHSNPNQLPPAGAIAVFGPAPQAGYTSTFPNPDGHVGVVDHANGTYVYLMQQDSSEAQVHVELKGRAWRYTECLGWLLPRVQTAAPAANAATGPANHPLIGKQVWLHVPTSNVANGWSVYRRGQYPDRAKRIGCLRPDWFHNGPGGQPGLVYTIESVSQYANTVGIHSDTYGPIDIYLDSDAQIL
jgi:hypothetical protein